MKLLVLPVYWIVRVQLWIAAACALTLSGLVFASAVTRYLLKSPWSVTEELVGLLFYSSCMLVLPATTFAGKQLRLNFVDTMLPPRALRVVSMIASAALLAMLVVLIRYSLENAFFTRSINARSEIARLDLFPWMLVAPLSLATMMAAVLVHWLPGSDSLPPLVPGLDEEEDETL